MSVIKKTLPYICPRCGGSTTLTDEIQVDYEDTGILFSIKTCCEVCDTNFTDHFLGRYDGYTDDTGVYSKEGNLMVEPLKIEIDHT